MDYLKTRKIKLIIILITVFISFQVFKFIKIRISNLDLPKGKIIFSSYLRGHGEIYLMNLNGADLRRLTSYSSFGRTFDTWFSDLRPSFSYDGRKIVFYSDRDDKRPKMERIYYTNGIVRERSLPTFDEIYTMDVSGKHLIRLTHNQLRYRSPVFSPDGQKVLFYSVPYPENPFYEELRIIYSSGRGERILGTGHNISLLAKFSTDSRKVFFVLRGDLYSKNIYGDTPIRLTHFNDRDIERPDDIEGQLFIDEFALSPDGKEIILVTKERKVYEFTFYSMNSDGSEIRKIAHLANTGRFLYVAMINNLTYSPDGQKIAFISDFGSSSLYILDRNHELNLVMNLNKADSGIEGIEDDRFVFTPDSKHVIFVASFPYGPFDDLFTWIKSIGHEFFLKIKYYVFGRISGPYDNKYLCIMDLKTGKFKKISRLPLSRNNLGRDFIHWEK